MGRNHAVSRENVCRTTWKVASELRNPSDNEVDAVDLRKKPLAVDLDISTDYTSSVSQEQFVFFRRRVRCQIKTKICPFESSAAVQERLVRQAWFPPIGGCTSDRLVEGQVGGL